jgi:hypothetical protein
MRELIIGSIGPRPNEEITTPPDGGGGGGGGGNGPDTVVVVGNPVPYAPDWGMGDPGSGGGDSGNTGGGGDPGSNGGLGPGYTPLPGASSAATAWADDHVATVSFDTSGNGVTSREIEYVQRYHDDLSRFYDWAHGHLGDSFDLGHGKTTTVAAVFNAIDIAVVNVYVNPDGPQPDPYHPGQYQEELAGPRGGISRITTVNGLPEFDAAMIYIQPGNPNVVDYHNNYSPNTGVDYLLFHEMGHVIEGLLNNSLQAEGAGNYVARELELALNLKLLSDQAGNLVEPGGGYVW